MLGERSLYDSEWVRSRLLDVVHPDGHRYEHHALRQPLPAVGCVVRRAWTGRGGAAAVAAPAGPRRLGVGGPGGPPGAGRDAGEAAARETLEETGWTVRDVRHVTGFHPIGGGGDHRFEVCLAAAGEQVGPHDPAEADRVEWVGLADVRGSCARARCRRG